MAEGISSCLPIAMRMVGDAIRLDSQNCKKEAYCQYLSCCVYISQILKDDAWDKDLKLAYNKDSAKLFKLIQQCQERALTIISSEGIHPTESPTGSPVFPHSQQTQSLTPPQDNLRKLSDSCLPTRDTASLPKGHVRTSSGNLLNFPSPPSSPSTGYLSNASMKPMTKSTCNYYQQDRRLMGHHLKVVKSSTSNTDKTLTSIRRMSENLAIAKAREEAIRKKVWERQQRLQQEANRRFASAGIASQEEQEQRALYTRILEYEQDVIWPQQLREKLKQSPEDTTLINNIINRIFSSKDHPLKQFLLQYQYHVYKKLLPLLKDVNFPDAKHLNKPSSSTASEDNKDNERGVCPLSTTDKVDEVEEQTSEIHDTCEVLVDEEENKSSEEVKETDKADKEDNTDDNEEFEEKVNDNFEVNNLNDFENEDNTSGTTNVNEGCVFNTSGEANTSKTENEFSNDKESKNETVMQQDDISSIVSCIVESILDEVVKAGPDKTVAIDENEDVCEESQKEVYDSQVRKCDENNSEEIIEVNNHPPTASTEETSSNEFDKDSQPISCPGDVEETGRSNAIDNYSSFSSNTASKKKNLLRIKSFDVESEFESLEDDMFDSGSSEDEEEHEGKELNVQTDEDAESSANHTNNDASTLPGLQTSQDESTEAVDVEFKSDSKSSFESGNEGSASAESTKDDSSKVPNTDIGQEQAEQTISHEEELEMTRKQLSEIFVDIRFFLEKLKGFIIVAYEELATPIGHDQCYAAVEYPFFQPLWPLLLGVLRRVNFDKELSLGCVMTKRIRNSPVDMGVVDRLCLLDEVSVKLTGNQYPYQSAVDQLHKVSTSYCPLEKLECLVHVLRSICQCVEDYWEAKGRPRHCSETSIGCDDLLPILCYVIVRSGMAQLVSECSFMEEFIPEGYLMGEEGYCLTTLLTALAYLVTQE